MRRRSFLKAGTTTAAAVGAGLALNWSRGTETAFAETTVSGGRVVPRVLVERATAGDGAVRPDMRFDFVAVNTGRSNPTEAEIRFEVPAGPTSWRPLHFHSAGPDGAPAEATALARAPQGSIGYEVRVGDGEPVRATAINLRDGNGVTIDGATEGGLYSTSATDSGATSRVHYLTRAGWGADESLRFNDDGEEEWPAEYFPVQAITVHHSALEVGDDPAAGVRAIYQLHAAENGWGDIGYHLLVGPEGRVYEGRYSGEDGLPVFAEPPKPGQAEAVTAGHVYQMNSGNIGVCLLGDFTDAMPTQAAQDSLVRVLRVLCQATGVDPNTEVEYVNPVNGVTASQLGVSRHRDWLATACPGDTFAAQFDAAIRSRLTAPSA